MMAELQRRIESEDEFKAKLAELSELERAELIVLLGNPPDPRNVPESFWREVQSERQSEIFNFLFDTFEEAAWIHGMSEDDAEARARRFAKTRASDVAKGFVECTREMLARAWRKWDAQIAEIRANGAKQELSPAEVRSRIRAYIDCTLENDIETMLGKARDARMAQHEFSVAQAEGAEAAAQDFEAIIGIKLERWWRHSELRPPRHSNAQHVPCEICSDLEGTQAPWFGPNGETRPGLVHVGCDCYTEYVIGILGIIWCGEAVTT